MHPGKGGTLLTRRLIFATLLLFFVAACDESDSSSATGTQTPPSAAASPASPPAATPSPALAGPLPRVRLERVFPGLSFVRMTGLYQAPDGRWFVTEQRGRIFVFEDRPDAQARLFLDLTDRVNSIGNEEGLLGFAFAPDFATSGNFYLNYTAANPRRSVISRFTATLPGANTADRASEFVLLEVGQPFSNHNGGQIVFGPDGYLYIGFGDGGSARDPMGNGQNLGVLLAKLLRIDVSGTSPGRAYQIPPDNPFAGRAGARAEIWAYGLRNPWRFSFDPQTGDLWLADVGQNAREEVDLITKGGNYGWSVTEGSNCLSAPNCDKTGITLPLFEYATGANCSVTGGFVYRGQAIAALRGAYVYGDYCSGRVWALRYDGTRVTAQVELIDADIRISSFAVDRNGELYALAHADSGGGIFKLLP